jgi:hypothetical protein
VVNRGGLRTSAAAIVNKHLGRTCGSVSLGRPETVKQLHDNPQCFDTMINSESGLVQVPIYTGQRSSSG